ncbi:MAG: hypothetical protein QM703_02635 [Gemmatales bacterium]
MISDQQIGDASLEWGHPNLSTIISNSSFERCEININCSARGIIFSECIFQECTIKVKRPFTSYQFYKVGFEGCSFIGRYPGCEFGYRSLPATRREKRKMKGFIRRCDFRQAMLDLVAFNTTDLDSLLLPPWPHFVVKSEAAFSMVKEFANDAKWMNYTRIGWPTDMSSIVMIYHSGGNRGFRMAMEDALGVLQQYPDVITITKE